MELQELSHELIVFLKRRRIMRELIWGDENGRRQDAGMNDLIAALDRDSAILFIDIDVMFAQVSFEQLENPFELL